MARSNSRAGGRRSVRITDRRSRRDRSRGPPDGAPLPASYVIPKTPTRRRVINPRPGKTHLPPSAHSDPAANQQDPSRPGCTPAVLKTTAHCPLRPRSTLGRQHDPHHAGKSWSASARSAPSLHKIHPRRAAPHGRPTHAATLESNCSLRAAVPQDPPRAGSTPQRPAPRPDVGEQLLAPRCSSTRSTPGKRRTRQRQPQQRDLGEPPIAQHSAAQSW